MHCVHRPNNLILRFFVSLEDLTRVQWQNTAWRNALTWTLLLQATERSPLRNSSTTLPVIRTYQASFIDNPNTIWYVIQDSIRNNSSLPPTCRDLHIISSVAPSMLTHIIFAHILVVRINVISVSSVSLGKDAGDAIVWNVSLKNC